MTISSSPLSILLSFITLIYSLFGLIPGKAEKEVVVPTYTDLPVIQKTEYDEGVFSMGEYDIIVSPDGNDCNDGSVTAPLKTLDGAKEKAKELKGTAENITVWFREGTYSFTDTVKFDENDFSGITYRSYPNEKVFFTGANEYKNWTEDTVNGVRCFVTDAGITNETFFNSCFKGDERLQRPCYPKNGQFTVKSVDLKDAADPDGGAFKIQISFNANKNDLLNFKNIHDVDVRILHYWNDELLPIDYINLNTGKVVTEKPASMTIADGDRYYFENVFEALKNPGEWYLDRTENKLYYIPENGDTINNTVIKAAFTEELIDINGSCGINFEGIVFTETDWETVNGSHFSSTVTSGRSELVKNAKYSPNFPQAAYDIPGAVTVKNAENINFTNCRFTRTGNAGIMFAECVKHSSVKTSEFYDIGSTGVYIRGNNTADESLQSYDIKVTDCHISKYGRIYNNAIGVLLIHARDCEISHNEIHDGLYSAVSSGWVWGYAYNVTDNIKITNNLIYDIGQGWLSDMGGIYTLGVQPHSIISGNVIHDVGCYSGDGGYGGWGIYLDEGTSGMTVKNNLCYNCSSEGFHQHYGKENVITNNIFALNGDAQVILSKKEEHLSFTLDTNILLSNNSPMYYNVVSDTFKDNNNFYWDLEREEKVFSGHSIKSGDKKTVSQCKRKGFYNDAHFENPLFRDPLNFDFTIADNSPVIKAGFTPWNYNEAGVLTEFSFN